MFGRGRVYKTRWNRNDVNNKINQKLQPFINIPSIFFICRMINSESHINHVKAQNTHINMDFIEDQR